MEILEFLKALIEHSKTGKGYQIHLNSSMIDDKSAKNIGIVIEDLYFTECDILNDQTLLCFGNVEKKLVSKSEEGTDLYPIEINSNIFMDINKIEAIENVEDFEDWFYVPSNKVINIYMFPEDDNLTGNRNVITVGFID